MRMRARMLGAVMAALSLGRLKEVTTAKDGPYSYAQLGEIFTAAHFSPQRGFEHVLARRGANTYHAKPARGRRYNQMSAKARQRWKYA